MNEIFVISSRCHINIYEFVFFINYTHKKLNTDVTIIPGFLSTEDVEAPGNYGLLDQSLALRFFFHYKYFIIKYIV